MSRNAHAVAWLILLNCCCRCFEVLQQHTALCSQYQQRFQLILVDEFQDTNALQYRWPQTLGTNASQYLRGR